TMYDNIPKENTKIHHNITLDQRKAIKSLSEDTSIVIKEADKGGGIVIMNAQFYKSKILEMLMDESYYTSIPNSNEKEVFTKLKQLIDQNKNITIQEIDFLLNFDYKTSTFYGLPKIHKSKLIQNACNIKNSEYIEVLDPDDLQFRPIVAGPRCETSRLSSLLDILLKPFLKHVKSYLRDDIDFLNFLPNNVPENTLLVSFDVVSLYSNIPHTLGQEAVSYWLEKYPELISERFSKDFILEGLKLILENNNFSFNDLHFNQSKGTAMGTKVAPTYATLVLGFLEETLYENIKLEMGEQFGQYVENQWKRYLDDCFILWQMSREDLNIMESILNSLHEDIIFKIQVNPVQLPFLDTLVIKNGTSISTDIYFKVTDSKQYLNFKSCHPKHTKTNVPFSLARRICTIVSDKTLLNHRLKELATTLTKRNYPLSIIQHGISKALQIPRKNLLNVKEKTKEKTEEKVTPFISTHNPKNKEMFGILKNNMEIFNSDKTMNRIINNTKVIKCKRQLPNLKRMLIKSDFNETNTPPSVSKCNEPRCGLCKFIIEGSTLQLKNKTFRVKENMNCTVKNVLYVLICNGCKEFYIGQTGDKLRNRRTVHDQQIRDPSTRQLPVSFHLDQCSLTNPKFSIFPFYKFHNNNVSARLTKEKYFIKVFNPKLNKSLTTPS
ncbi:MAG: GIY-YIG nuclease family protein, partial [Candidatus Thiodiazotropha taylori]|nr:GIY-YIG nuclease family protein [Candidatus Thiodiazotropha taylori]MCW4307985.1 GIY-YIG nuclease family protein [Candidatus Thiodiazotropha endolucinida]